MRYARLLAVLTVFTLWADLAVGQQAVFLPVVYSDSGLEDDVSDGGSSMSTMLDDYCFGDCCRRWYVSGEFLFWQATRNATPFAGTLTPISGTTHGLPISAGTSYSTNLINTALSRDGAFRINIGYMMCDDWDLGFRYTYFRTNGAASLGDPTVDSDSVLTNRLDRSLADDILNQDFDDGIADYARQNLGLTYNTYDIEIRRMLRLDSQRLAVRVMGGARIADIDQSSAIRYQDLESGVLRTADTDESMDMTAAGLFVGGEAHYLVGWNTSVFARGSVSLMYATFDVTRTDLQLGETNAGVRSISESYENIVPVVDLNVGLRWQRGRFYMAGGYDLANWFDMVNGLDVAHQDDVDGSTNSYVLDRGNLSFDGFFVEAGMMF